jgi:hypothetical protein
VDGEIPPHQLKLRAINSLLLSRPALNLSTLSELLSRPVLWISRIRKRFGLPVLEEYPECYVTFLCKIRDLRNLARSLIIACSRHFLSSRSLGMSSTVRLACSAFSRISCSRRRMFSSLSSSSDFSAPALALAEVLEGALEDFFVGFLGALRKGKNAMR